MNENEFDLTARAWLEDGPNRISDRALLSALEMVHTTRQRRALWPARRATPVNLFARAAIAAVLVVGVGFAAVNILPLGAGTGGPPAASPTADPTPSPAATTTSSASPPASLAPAVGIPELTKTFVSTNNGFSIDHSVDAVIEPAKVIANPAVDQDNEEFDFIITDKFGAFRGRSTVIPDGVATDEEIDRSLGYSPGGCAVPRSAQRAVTIDGQSGRIEEGCPGEVEATVVAGGRLYLFTLLLDARDRTAVFDAYAATIDLTPETAPAPSSSPAP
jgi:hypothetical protein